MAKCGAKPFEPTNDQRKIVQRAAAIGMTAEQIMKLIGVGKTTLWKYFGDELSTGGLKANLNVAGALYQNCMKGNVTAQIFWCKTRLGWKEINQTEITGDINNPVAFVSDKPLTSAQFLTQYAPEPIDISDDIEQ